MAEKWQGTANVSVSMGLRFGLRRYVWVLLHICLEICVLKSALGGEGGDEGPGPCSAERSSNV